MRYQLCQRFDIRDVGAAGVPMRPDNNSLHTERAGGFQVFGVIVDLQTMLWLFINEGLFFMKVIKFWFAKRILVVYFVNTLNMFLHA